MKTMITVYLDTKDVNYINYLAGEYGGSKSKIYREAIKKYLEDIKKIEKDFEERKKNHEIEKNNLIDWNL